jgi:hypothetical protein
MHCRKIVEPLRFQETLVEEQPRVLLLGNTRRVSDRLSAESAAAHLNAVWPEAGVDSRSQTDDDFGGKLVKTAAAAAVARKMQPHMRLPIRSAASPWRSRRYAEKRSRTRRCTSASTRAAPYASVIEEDVKLVHQEQFVTQNRNVTGWAMRCINAVW